MANDNRYRYGDTGVRPWRTIGQERICPKWHAEAPDRVVAADTLVAGDPEEDDGYSE